LTIPGIYNFTIYQGASWGQTFYFGDSAIGLTLLPSSAFNIVVNGTAKTYVRNDGGSFLADGLVGGDYIVVSGFPNRFNNGSHLTTTVTASTVTCAGDTMVTETVLPSLTGAAIYIIKALNFTGATGAAMIRKTYASVSAAATITVTFPAPLTSGAIAAALTNTQTAAMTAGASVCSSASQYVWDLEVTQAGLVSRKLMGAVSVDPEATK
jgi:hypothetical protein